MVEFQPRVLPSAPIDSLDEYVRRGGGRGAQAAARLGPEATVDEVTASGLRGRGGAGFPTGRKWQSVVQHEALAEPTAVVVNAAEGEPGSFKDRAILRGNPYSVLEGALIAASAVGANEVIIALKESFTREISRVQSAVDEMRKAHWSNGAIVRVFAGPNEYLYGEETALLEAIDGRGPFPRIAPPYRHGVDEFGPEPAASAARVELAARAGEAAAPPTLVNNVETLANVPAILAFGADWFREVGTDESTGTIVCTITGATRRHGVGELPMGTPLRKVIEAIGGGATRGHEIVAVMSGVANPLVPTSALDTPASHEAMQALGTGLGASGFIVFDDTTDLTAVAAGVSRFLAVESCGQCTPCKQDGLELARLLERISRSDGSELDLLEINKRVASVSYGARCNLALQHQYVVGSVLAMFPEGVRAHALRRAPSVEPELIAPIVDIDDGRAVLDEGFRSKQPDWTYVDTDSGQSPADRFEQRSTEALEDREGSV